MSADPGSLVRRQFFDVLLDPEANSLLRRTWEEYARTSTLVAGRVLRWKPNATREDMERLGAMLKRLTELGLLVAEGDAYRPSVIALVLLEDKERLHELQRIIAQVHARYGPQKSRLEIERGPGWDSDAEAIAAVTPFVADIGYQLLQAEANGSAYGVHVNERLAGIATLDDAIVRARPYLFRSGAGTTVEELAAPAYAVQLKRLEVTGFRVLRHLALELPSALTVLVGPNGVGKSTVLDAIAFIAQAAASPQGLGKAIERERGLARVRSRGAAGPMELSLQFEVELEPKAPAHAGEYAFTLGEIAGSPNVERETLRTSRGADERVWVKRNGAIAHIADALGVSGARSIHVPGNELGVCRIATGAPASLWRSFASTLLVDRDARLIDEKDLSPSFSETTHRRTRRASAVDPWLQEAVATDAATQRFEAALRPMLPELERVTRVPLLDSHPAMADLRIVERGVTGASGLDEISAGMRQILVLAALLVAKSPPATILLEEPDAALHPDRLPALRDLLRELSRRSTVIATTHSAAFVGTLDAAREVVALDREGERVRATTLAVALRSAKWVGAFGDTGEAFLRRALETKP